MSVWKYNFKLKAERGVAVRGWRRDAVKKHRAMPYAIWPHRAYGSGWTPGTSCALWWSIGDAAFHHKTYRLYPVFLTPPLGMDFWPPRHSPLGIAIHGHRQWCEIIDYAWPGLDCAIISITIILFQRVQRHRQHWRLPGLYVVSGCHIGGTVFNHSITITDGQV